MMLAGPQPAHDNAMLRVALATTHLPLRAVADAVTVPLLLETLSIIDATCAAGSALRGRASL